MNTNKILTTNSLSMGKCLAWCAALLLAGLLTPVHAANLWDGGGADDNWGTALNWDDDNVPAFPVALTFAGGTRLTPTNEAAGRTVNGVTFNAGAGAFTLVGDQITLAGNVTNNSTALQTIALPMTSTALRTFTTAAGGGDLALGASFSGTGGGITKAGSGTLNLNATNSYTGNTVISAGTLKFGANNAVTTSATIRPSNAGTVVDLAGTTQKFGPVQSDVSNGTGVWITNSSGTLSQLTIDVGAPTSVNDFQYQNGNFGGAMKLIITGNMAQGQHANGNAFQMGTGGNNNNYNGGTLLTGWGTTALSSANFRSDSGFITSGAGSLTNTAAVRINNGVSPFGTNIVTLDNGCIWNVNVAGTLTNDIVVTSRGGILRSENSSWFYTGRISGSGMLALVGNNTGLSFNLKDLADFTGTVAVASSVVANVNISNSWFNGGPLIFWGNGAASANVRWNGTPGVPVTNRITQVISGVAGGAVAAGRLSSAVASDVTFVLGEDTASTPTFGGIIQNGSGVVSVMKVGTNKQTLSTAATYTGSTVVSNGTLAVVGLASTNVTVHAPALLEASGTIAGPVTLNSGAAGLSLVNNTVGTLTVGDATTGLTLNNGNVLSFDVGATPDSIAVSGAFAQSGAASIVINQITGFGGGTYDLITGASGILAANFTLAGSFPGYSVGLTNPDASTLRLTVTVSAPASAFWHNRSGAAWNTITNWDTDQSSGIALSSLPTGPTDVTFAADAASVFNTTLGADFSIKNLAFNTASAVTIGGANTLTLNGNLTVGSGAGNNTVNASAMTLGVDSTWTITDGGATLAVSSPIGGTKALATAGAGTVTLSGTSSYSGGTLVSGTATLALGHATDTLANAGAVRVDGGTLSIGANSDTVGAVSLTNGTISGTSGALTGATFAVENGTISANIAGGSLTKNTAGEVLLSGTNSYSGGTTVNAGTLKLGSSSALGTGNATINLGGAIDLDGQTTTRIVSVAGTGPSTLGALVNTSATPAVVESAIGNGTAYAVDATGDITIQRSFSIGGPWLLTKNGAGTLTFGTASTAGHNNLMALRVNAGTVVLNMPGFLSVDRDPLEAYNSSLVRLAGSGGNQIQEDRTVNLFDTSSLDLNGRSEAIGYLNVAVGAVVSNGAPSTTSTLTVGGGFGSGGLGTVVGPIVDGAGTVALTKGGTNVLTLYGANTYSGSTIVNNGTLALSEPGTINNSALINIVSGATLDVTARTDQTLTLQSGQTLMGNGSLNGNLVTLSNSTVNPGASVGTLIVTNNITLAGKLLLELNTATALTNDKLQSVSGTITYGGTLLVTNIGPLLQVSNVFQLFTNAVTTFASIQLATTDTNGYTYTWTNNIPVDGSIMLLSATPPITVDPNPTNIVSSVSGSTLTLSWPASHIGWTLQTQTNSRSVGLTVPTNTWYDVSGSSSTNLVDITIDKANPTVFFRLHLP